MARGLSKNTLAAYVRQSTAEHLTADELAQAARAAGFKDATARMITKYRWNEKRRATPAPTPSKLRLVKPRAVIPIEQEWFKLVARIGTDRALEIVERVRARADLRL